nr:hypothetical protein [uncultured Campylobacter sp.]
MSCYKESEIAIKALDVIKRRPGIKTSELIDELRIIMKPSGEDLTILDGRNDDKFSQKVRNLKSHNSIQDKVITVGDKDRQWYLKNDYPKYVK